MNEPSAAITADDLKWDVRQRLKLLEATALLTGWVRTQSLVAVFGISRAQASKDFALYLKVRPDNLRYDRSSKRYVANAAFHPWLLRGKTSELLSLVSQVPGVDRPVVALTAQAPAVAMVNPLERELDLSVFRVISQAATNGLRVSLSYQSMNRPEPAALILSPHSLVYSGFRWHVRAFSDSHDDYRDFVLARIRGPVKLLDVAGVSAADDQAWHRMLAVTVQPHPALPKAQQAVIAEDYGMTDGQITVSVRQALLGYFLTLMRLEPEQQHPEPKVQQIVLANPDELSPYLW